LRTQIKVADLSNEQFERLDHRLFTSYDIPVAAARVCVVFELAPDTERHVEMPVQEFATLMTELAMVGAVPATAEAILSPDVLPDNDPIEEHPAPCGFPSVAPCICRGEIPMPDVYVGIAPLGTN
jgi:hypothetical protein